MKLYVVATDDYEEYYGAEINLHGVFSEEELAKDYLKNKYLERIKETGEEFSSYNLEGFINLQIKEVELDKECDIYLGGYYE